MEVHVSGDQPFQLVRRGTLTLVSGGKTVQAEVMNAVKMQSLMTMGFKGEDAKQEKIAHLT